MPYTIEGKHVIVLGDTTSHGGKVITGSENHTYMGIPVARVGDMVKCPKCNGTFHIIEGAPRAFDHGKAIARHGDKVACGATLISRENITDTMLVAAASCPTNVQTFFDEQYARLAKLAKELNIDPDYLMALSSYESGWLNNHNRALNNLFGLTEAGGPNLQFKSLDSCIDFWKNNNGDGVKDSKNMSDFILNLRKMKYNTVNKDYDKNLIKQYNYILKMKNICTVPKIA